MSVTFRGRAAACLRRIGSAIGSGGDRKTAMGNIPNGENFGQNFPQIGQLKLINNIETPLFMEEKPSQQGRANFGVVT